MRSQSLTRTFLVAAVFASVSGSGNASGDSTIDTQSLYAARAGSVDLPIEGITISHVEGCVSIERCAGEEGHTFEVTQEMDCCGEVCFAGFSPTVEAQQVQAVFGRLMILPDGTLHIEYDALRAEGTSEAGSVTAFTLSDAVVVLRRRCDCEDIGIAHGCFTNHCNEISICPQDPSLTAKCRWFETELFVQPLPNP